MKRIVLAMLMVAGTACSMDGAPKTKVTIQLNNSEHVDVMAEVADTPHEREQGLMNREKMDEMDGMVFLWPAASRNVFWMKNTLIPLDMLFIQDGRIVAISANAKPMDETPIDPGVNSDAVLEVNGGWAERHHVEVGDKVVIRR